MADRTARVTGAAQCVDLVRIVLHVAAWTFLARWLFRPRSPESTVDATLGAGLGWSAIALGWLS